MKHLLIAPALALALVGSAALATTAKPYVGHELAGQAHITLAQAQVIALKARPGQITDRELEKEAGGSGLRWSFDIKAHGKAYEVGVDAQTGKVLESKAEGPHPD
jgi:uncharacterized membrane protein YkoI